jgi:type VI protein secretion system component VasK
MSSYPLLDVFLTMMWFFLWTMWIFLLVWIIMDIFRSQDMGGWAKAGWVTFVILLPFLGVLVYLIARGKNMGERQEQRARAEEDSFRSYVRETAASDGHAAEEINKLADLRNRGVITEAEFQQGKAKVLA